MSTDESTTVFELLDNFFGSQQYPGASALSNAQVRDLRDNVVTFHNTFRLTRLGDFHTRLYLGSFLSSPPISVESSPYLASALLCADSVILFEPLHYWFCDEQYKRDRLLSAPPGWKTPQRKYTASHVPKQVLRPDYPGTRVYLDRALTWLSNVRPLVDAGIVVLIPSEQIVFSGLNTINEFSEGIKNQLKPLDKLARDFRPEEITVDDNRKGLFTFAGGDREFQIQHSLGRGIELFAKDVVIANATGSLYTAPFRWEQALGEASLDGFAAAASEAKVVEGVRHLKLPILSNLSPNLVVKIHGDARYSSFRASLSEALQNIQEEIGSPDFVNRVTQIGADILRPKIEAILDETKSSAFERITKATVEGAFTFMQTFLANMPTGLDSGKNVYASGVGGGLAFARELLTGIWKKRDHRLWAQLLPEKPTPSVYGSPLILKQQAGAEWDIDEKPSMAVKIAAGILKAFSQ